MQPSGLGIIGYGGFGRFVHQAWSRLEEVRVVAVADTDSKRRPEGVRFYSAWQDLVRDDHVDIVAIVTPPFTHADMACEAMEAGKHVLIEKPLATTLEDARRIQVTQARTGKVASVDYMLRFNPIVEALQTWSREGYFGGLRRVVVENYAQDEALSPDHWFWDPRLSGGILVEHAVHFIDVVNGCTNTSPVRIDGLSVYRNPDQEDRMMVTVVYEDGLVASHFHAFSRPHFFEQTTMRFVFDLAQVEVQGWIPLSGSVTSLVNDETIPHLHLLPNFRQDKRQPVKDLSATGQHGPLVSLRSGGETYTVDTQIDGTFEVGVPKLEAYASALQALMADLVRAIRVPGYRPRVTVAEGISSLEIALSATEQAHQNFPHLNRDIVGM